MAHMAGWAFIMDYNCQYSISEIQFMRASWIIDGTLTSRGKHIQNLIRINRSCEVPTSRETLMSYTIINMQSKINDGESWKRINFILDSSHD